MDQDSFRKLLSTSSSKPPAPGNVFKPSKSKSKKDKGDSAKPSFKPRAVKKQKQQQTDAEYRDRAAERRGGLASDYAQVEALAEDFERKNAENQDRIAVEEQRRYLGGDSEHTVLVKGLDFALLEQNKARAATSTEDDDSLEQAFLDVTVPKKRTREEIVRELKNKRAKADPDGSAAIVEDGEPGQDKPLEEAKKAGKFKPIGFKPVASNSKEGVKKKKKKVKKVAKGGEEDLTAEVKGQENGKPDVSDRRESKSAATPPPAKQPAAGSSKAELEPADDDFDIFADAGEYTGVDLGDDDEDSDLEAHEAKGTEQPREESPHDEDEPRQKWFDLDDEPKPLPPPLPPPASAEHRSLSPPARHEGGEEGEVDAMDQDEDEEPIRLVPLSSSAIPSIKDILAMDEEVKKQDKRKAKKEKKKKGGGSGLTTERKVERDYQRLKSYTEKKGGGS